MSATALIIKKVSDELGLKSRFLDDSKFVLEVDFGDKAHIFIANNSGLNNEVVREICNDKFYTYLLIKDEINLPKTQSFVDINAENIYGGCNNQWPNEEIVVRIKENHKFPVLVKANSLSRGLNVFKCADTRQVSKAVESIFNKNSKDYDYVLISQNFIDIAEEFRVVVYDQKIMFVYKKNNSEDARARFVGNLSPLHWENSKTVLIKNKVKNSNTKSSKILMELSNFIKPIYSKLDLKYGGLDIARDKNGKLWLIEINSQPGFTFFIRDNSSAKVVKMYRKILGDLKENQ